MAYDLDEFEDKAAEAERLKAEEASKAAEAEKAKLAEESKKQQDADKAEKAALQQEIANLKASQAKIAKAFGPDSEPAKDPYDELVALGFKPDELKGLDKINRAWFKKNLGIEPEEFTKRYNLVAQTATGTSVITADLNYDKAKTQLFKDIQASKPEIRADYFMQRLEELEGSMKPEVFAQIKNMPPKELMETLKTTYYNEIGRVKADPKGISDYKKFTDEAEATNKEDKIASGNKGGWSSNIAREMTDADFEKKGMGLQEAMNKELFSV